MEGVESLTHGERRERGEDTFRRVLATVDRAGITAGMERSLGALGTFAIDVAGEMWSRPELSRRDRSITVVAALGALMCGDQVELHVAAARRHGLEPREIDEIMVTVGAYAGFPAATSAMRRVDAGLRAADGDDGVATRAGASGKSDDERDRDAHEVFTTMKGGEVEGGVADHHQRMVRRYGRVGLVAYRYAFGEVWARTELTRRDRSLTVISILTAIGAVHELNSHVPAGIRHGLTAVEIDAALAHLALYVGLPRAIDAARVAHAMFAELGVDPFG